jgi:radical SAM protein with 4Fe4S-binding SPASM domain
MGTPLNWKINHVQVQTISWCNRSCAICPSQKFPRKLEFMSLETYPRVLEELASLGFSGRFSPYLQGEPLLDKRMPELLARARATLPQAKLLIQSNGDALTVEKGLALFEAGLHKLIINCYDDGEQLSRVQDVVREMVGRQFDLRLIKGSLARMTRSEHRSQIRREIAIENKTWWKADTADNWAGNIPGALTQPLKKWCFRPFNQLYVHFNGNVVLCCCDWKGEVIFGNLTEASLSEVYSSPIATEYRQNLAKKNRKMKLCEICDYRGKYKLIYRLMLFISRLGNKARDTQA